MFKSIVWEILATKNGHHEIEAKLPHSTEKREGLGI